jgi:hypothetical protein
LGLGATIIDRRSATRSSISGARYQPPKSLEASTISAVGISRLIRHRYELVALAVGTGAPAPAVVAVRHKGIGDKLHSMLTRSVERER